MSNAIVFVSSLVACAGGAACFGMWQGSAFAGWWMFVVLVMAEGVSENLKR